MAVIHRFYCTPNLAQIIDTSKILIFLIFRNVSPSFMLVAHAVSLFISNISSYSHKGLVARKLYFVAWEQGQKAACTSFQSDLHIFYSLMGENFSDSS